MSNDRLFSKLILFMIKTNETIGEPIHAFLFIDLKAALKQKPKQNPLIF